VGTELFSKFYPWFIGLLLMLVSGTSFSATQTDYDLALSHWAKVLDNYVNEQGQIDFLSLAKQPDNLLAYVQFVADVSPDTEPRLFSTKAAVLAYHLNTYNALAMHGVIDKGIPSDFDSFFKRLRFFKLREVVIGGESTSLYDYENEVIRPLREPRVHFALNCMVKDCPHLPRKAFVADTLEQDLTQLSHKFFNAQKHLNLDDGRRIAYVSEILDFYTEDFVSSGKPQDLIPYINRFRDSPIPLDYRIKFIDYDWTINQQSPQ